MGYFKDLEIDGPGDRGDVDPNQMELFGNEMGSGDAESRSMAPTASSQSLDSALTALDVPYSAYMPTSTSAPPAASSAPPGAITRPGKLTVKDIRYIEEFLAKRLKVG